MYPIVTSFDALKQSTEICAHRITFSSRKFIILNKLSYFNQSILFGRSENIFFVKNECMCAAMIYFDRHHFRRLSLAVEENNFSL